MEISVYTIVLLVILILVLLFIIGSHYKLFTFNHKSEKFVDKAHDAYEDTIRSVFKTYLLRDPVVDEITKYKGIMNSPNDLNKVMPKIKKTQEYQDILKNTERSRSDNTYAPNIPLQINDYDIIDTRVHKLEMNKKTALYREVIEIYDITLNRMPTMKELNYYTARMASDEEMTRDQLKKILESSREYHILKRNQSNQVFGELPMNATTTQIAYEVDEIYRETMGLESSDAQQEEDNDGTKSLNDSNKNLMSEEMMQFLKHKYVEYELNKDKLRDLIKLIHKLDENNLNVQKILNYDFKKGYRSQRIRNLDLNSKAKNSNKNSNEKLKEETKECFKNQNKQISRNSSDSNIKNTKEQEKKQEIKGLLGNKTTKKTSLPKLREEFEEIRRKYSPNPVEEVEDEVEQNYKKRMKKMGKTFSNFTYPKTKGTTESFVDSEGSETDQELRQRRQDVVKKRFEEMKKRRKEGTNTMPRYENPKKEEEEENEKRQKRFDAFMEAKNRRVRSYYENENKDAIPSVTQKKSRILSNDEPVTDESENEESENEESENDKFVNKIIEKRKTQEKENADKKIGKTNDRLNNEIFQKMQKEKKEKVTQEDGHKDSLCNQKQTLNKHRPQIKHRDPVPLTEYKKDPDCIFGNNLDAPKLTGIPPYVTDNYIFLNNGYKIYDKEDDEVNKKLKQQKKLDTNIDPYRKINNATKQIYDKRRNGLAYMQNERNMNELSHICHRQTDILKNKPH